MEKNVFSWIFGVNQNYFSSYDQIHIKMVASELTTNFIRCRKLQFLLMHCYMLAPETFMHFHEEYVYYLKVHLYK